MGDGAYLINVWISARKTELFDPTTVECCAEQLHEVKAPDWTNRQCVVSTYSQTLNV